MDKIFLVLMMSFLFSCGHSPIGRYAENGMPLVPIKNHGAFTAQRSPASLKGVSGSNRLIYFLTLEKQYAELASLVGHEKNPAAACPQFHHQRLLESQKNARVSLDKKNISDTPKVHPENQHLYPELSLVSPEFLGAHRSVVEAEVMADAIVSHLNILRKEIQEMCNFGNSNNSFIYENLIRHIASNPTFIRGDQGPRALTRLPIVANRLVLESLSPERSLDPVESEAFHRIKSSWVGGYMRHIVATREKLPVKDMAIHKKSTQNAWNLHSRSFGK